MKRLLIAVLIIVLSVAAALSWPSNTRGEVEVSSWTKAICDDSNFCIDIEIVCASGRIVDLKPVKYGVQFDKAWADPRSVELQNTWC